MKINISGNIELGESFPVYVQEKFDKEVSKFFLNLSVVDVHVKKQNDIIYVNITLDSNKTKAEANGKDIRKTFDEACKKLIDQVKKEKDKAITKKKKGE